MIHTERLGDLLVMRIAHGKANALDVELATSLDQHLHAATNSGARALVLTGTGRIFGAGVDLVRVLAGGADYLRAFLPALDDALRRLWTLPIPTVAAVNGHAIAGGAILALACDQRVMATGRARFGVPELRVGVPFPPLVLEIMRAAVGPPQVDELIGFGRYYHAYECLAHGFVHSICDADQVLAQAIARARELATAPAKTHALHKRLWRLPALRYLEQNAHAIAAEVVAVWTDPDTLAAIRAYVAHTLAKQDATREK